MQRVRRKHTNNLRRETRRVIRQVMPLDDKTLTTPVTLLMIQALLLLGLKAVEDALLREVATLAGPHYSRTDDHPEVVRWGAQDGSIYLADQKLPVAAEAVPEAFGLARSSVSRRFIRASAGELRRLLERRLDDAEWLVLVLDGKTFAGDQFVVALGVTTSGEKRILGLLQTASENKRVIGQFLRELASAASRSTGLCSSCSSCSTAQRACALRSVMSSARFRFNAASGISAKTS